jgi:hypothetical protein
MIFINIRPASTLPYIDASGEPHTVKFSEHDTAVELKPDAHISVILWKKMYNLEPNMQFNGRVLDRYGWNLLDKVDFAFKFPFQRSI